MDDSLREYPKAGPPSLELESIPLSLLPSPAVGTKQAKSSGQGRPAQTDARGLGLASAVDEFSRLTDEDSRDALAAVCVTLAGKTAGGEEIVSLELARRFCGVVS